MQYKGKRDYIKKYSDYSHFKDLGEFNRHMEMFLAVHKRDFTKSEFIAFRRLTKYGAWAVGVATVSIGGLLRAIQKIDGRSVSESTFHRMKRKAIRKGILKVVERKSSAKKQTTNIWIFQKFQAEATKTDTPQPIAKGKRTGGEAKRGKKKRIVEVLAPLKAVKPIKTSNLNNREACAEEKGMRRIERKRKSAVPVALHAVLSAYFDDATYIGEFWRMAQYYVSKSGKLVHKEELLGLAMASFGAIKKYVKEASAKKPIALYNAVFKRNLTALLERNQEPVQDAVNYGEDESGMETLKTKLASRMKKNDFLLRIQSKGGVGS